MKNIIAKGLFIAHVVALSNCAMYDETVAKRLVYYSAAAFCKESTLENWNCGAACTGAPGIVNFTPVTDPTQ